MHLNEFVENTLGGAFVPVSSPSEADYHAAWLRHQVGREDPFLTAALGGAIADRLAWVFLAGHQGTIRRCFPTLPAEQGWCAFVNSEDRTGAVPGTSLTGGPGAWRFSGSKSWVAAADHIDRLIVSARRNEVPCVVIRRDQPGVVMYDVDPKSYLSELTQGRVRFEGVAVRDDQLTGDEQTFAAFGSAETAYIRVALNAFILSHAVRLGAPAFLVGGAVAGLFSSAVILYMQPPYRATALGLLGADTNTRWLATEFEDFIQSRDEVLYGLWIKDRSLVDGPSKGIAARAEAALRVASS